MKANLSRLIAVTFWKWKNQMQKAGEREPFPGMEGDLASMISAADCTGTDCEEKLKARKQLSSEISGIDHERLCNWLITRQFDTHLKSYQKPRPPRRHAKESHALLGAFNSLAAPVLVSLTTPSSRKQSTLGLSTSLLDPALRETGDQNLLRVVQHSYMYI